MRQHYQTPPPAPSTLNPRLSPAIDAVLMRALAKQPGERFASVTVFAGAFQEAVQSSGELHATLAISRAEAETGTIRRLTLPGGRHVNVTVPAGVADGALLRLEGQGMPHYEGGPAGPLLLTITIPPAEVSLPPRQDTVEPTLPVSPHSPGRQTPPVEATRMLPGRSDAPNVLEPTTLAPPSRGGVLEPTDLAASTSLPPTELVTLARQTWLPTEVARSSTPFAVRPDALAPEKPAKRNTSRRFVLLGMAGLIVVALASGIAWLISPRTSPTAITYASPAGVITEFAISTSCFPVPDVCTLGITAGPDGNLWFTETNNNKVGRITLNGSITEFAPPTPKSAPLNIAVGPDGNLWFTEFASSQIGRISTSGTITEFPIPTAQSGPNSIVVGPNGNLWFTEALSSQIGRISTRGTITEFPIPTPQSNPTGITAGPDGNLWFTEQGGNKIGRISTTGSITEFAVPTSASFPVGIVAGPDSNIWFTEDDGNKIGRISTSGTITEFPISTSGNGPVGITVGPDSNLWFTEGSTNKIGRITSGK